MNTIRLFIAILTPMMSIAGLQAAARPGSAAAAAAAGAYYSSSSSSSSSSKPQNLARGKANNIEKIRKAMAAQEWFLSQWRATTWQSEYERERRHKDALILPLPQVPTDAERKEFPDLDHEDQVSTPTPTLMPMPGDTLCQEGREAVYDHALAWLSTLNTSLSNLPAPLRSLVLSYAASHDNPVLNTLKWTTDQISIKKIALTHPLGSIGGGSRPPLCWLDKETIACLVKAPGGDDRTYLTLYNINTPNTPTLQHEVDAETYTLCCSRDGNRIATGSSTRITFWDRELNQFGTLPKNDIYNYVPGWSPDGTKFFYIHHHHQEELTIVSMDNLETPYSYYRYTTTDLIRDISWSSDSNYLMLLSSCRQSPSNQIVTIHVPTKKVSIYTVPHWKENFFGDDCSATIDETGKYLITPESPFRYDLLRNDLILKKTDLSKPKCSSILSNPTNIYGRPCKIWIANGLIIVYGYFSYAGDDSERERKTNLLLIDEKSGKIIRRLPWKDTEDVGWCQPSPDNAKLLVYSRGSVYVLEALYPLNKMYADIKQYAKDRPKIMLQRRIDRSITIARGLAVAGWYIKALHTMYTASRPAPHRGKAGRMLATATLTAFAAWFGAPKAITSLMARK